MSVVRVRLALVRVFKEYQGVSMRYLLGEEWYKEWVRLVPRGVLVSSGWVSWGWVVFQKGSKLRERLEGLLREEGLDLDKLEDAVGRLLLGLVESVTEEGVFVVRGTGVGLVLHVI